jgi:hypothetical protein
METLTESLCERLIGETADFCLFLVGPWNAKIWPAHIRVRDDILDEISGLEPIEPVDDGVLDLASLRQAVDSLIEVEGALRVVSPATINLAHTEAVVIKEDLKLQDINVVPRIAGEVDLAVCGLDITYSGRRDKGGGVAARLLVGGNLLLVNNLGPVRRQRVFICSADLRGGVGHGAMATTKAQGGEKTATLGRCGYGLG